MAGPAIIARRPDLEHLTGPIDYHPVSTRVVEQLGITHGDQTEILVAYVRKVHHYLFVSASVCLGQELGYQHFRIIKDYDSSRTPAGGYLFIVKVDSSADVDRLSGRLMMFGSEKVGFRRVMKLSHHIRAGRIDWVGEPRFVY
ncbi:unnamed protein product [Urochloa humidicola]